MGDAPVIARPVVAESVVANAVVPGPIVAGRIFAGGRIFTAKTAPPSVTFKIGALKIGLTKISHRNFCNRKLGNMIRHMKISNIQVGRGARFDDRRSAHPTKPM
jgi:hypothetical protein